MKTRVSDGSPQNVDALFNLDVHDASQGVQDSWIFFGDSITANAMGQTSVAGGTVGNFAQLIHAAKPTYYPAAEAGGIGGWAAADGAAHVATWIASFPGRYVALSYGTNDANGGCNTDSLAAFLADYTTMVNAVLAAGKVPVVPTIPWANTAN